MNAYTIQYAPKVRDDVARLPATMQARIDRAIVALGANPRGHGSIKLAGQENLYRARIGDYRIIYSINDPQHIVIILIVGHRREVYRDR